MKKMQSEKILESKGVIDSDLRFFPQQKVNCNICKVGIKAKYRLHKDSSWILNSPLTDPKHINSNRATHPTKMEMLVVTMVTGTGPCEACVSWH